MAPWPPPEVLDALLEIALDLTTHLPNEDRYRRLVESVRRVVPCDAAALLRFEDGVLVPVATDGLAPDALGRRFVPAEHPRLQAVLDSAAPVRFAAADPRPDPYDGLVDASRDGALHVHSCMGARLDVGGERVGVLSVDALRPGAFDAVDDRTFATFAALAAAALRTAGLIEALEGVAARRGQVTRQLVRDALQRQGGEILGRSEVVRRLRDEVDLVAQADMPVLVTGETGVGKELVARRIHAASPRRAEPLVHLNCAALPESVAESELFGHVRGSFTGAHADRAGAFELAHGGTLLLDEVGELPLSIQPKLLRALQSGELRPVGAERVRRVDARVIAATNRDLEAEVRAGRFRPDLYHRLSVYPIRVPALRERPEDVPILAGAFLDAARARLGSGPLRLSPAARAALARYAWPGNVRELEHVILRAALRAAGGARGPRTVVVDAVHLGLDEADGPAPGATATAAAPAPGTPDAGELPPLAEATDRFRRDLVQRALAATGGSWAEAARRLGVDRGNLHRLARRLGLR